MTVRPHSTHDARFVPASTLFEALHRQVAQDEVTVRWVLQHLDHQSFGLVLLLLGIVAAVPGICTVAGVLIVMLGFEMMLGREQPYFPAWIADRPLPTRRARPVMAAAIAALRLVEKLVRPRWWPAGNGVKRLVGLAVLLASLRLILVPVPFSNLLPAAIVALVALAYLERDGLLLPATLALAVANLALDLALVETVLGG